MNKSLQTTKSHVDVLVACALAAEARPIIEYYELQQITSKYGFKLYGLKPAKHQKIAETSMVVNVLVTGVGKINMAAALMWVQQLCMPRAFINHGIAGHDSADIGEIFLINKVFDEARGKSYYPSINFSWKGNAHQLKTVDTPSDEYHDGYVYDMEASAFCDIVGRFVGTESAHILKVISDNSKQSYQHVSKQSLKENIQASMPALDKLIENLLSAGFPESDNIQEVIRGMHEKWHITVAQEQQLRDVLLSTHVVEKNTGLKAPHWQTFEHLKEFLHASKQWVINTEPKLL